MNVRLHEFPGRTARLALYVDGSPLRAGEAAIDALGELKDVIWPLSAELAVDGAPRPHWLIQQAELPPGAVVKALMTDPVREWAPRLTRPVLLGWIERALAQPGAEGAGWSELHVATTRVRLPEAARWEGRATLALELGTRPQSDPFTAGEPIIHEVPIEWESGRPWVSGPDEHLGLQGPLAVQIANDDGRLTLDATAHWSLWTEGRGAELLGGALRRLAAAGWEVEHDGLGIQKSASSGGWTGSSDAE